MSTTAPVLVGRDGLPPKAMDALEAIRSFDGWASAKQIAALPELDGMQVKQLGKYLRLLIGRDLVLTSGACALRRYKAFDPDNPLGGGSEAQVMTAKSRPRGQAGKPVANLRVLRSRTLDHLSRRPLDVMTLALMFDVPLDVIGGVLDELVLCGAVVLLDRGFYRAAP